MKRRIYLWHVTFSVLTIPVNIFASEFASSRSTSESRLKIFSGIQEIRKIASDVAIELNARGAMIEVGMRENHAIRGTTDQGIFLSGDYYPDELITPWGTITIYETMIRPGTIKGRDIFEMFRRHLKLEFVENAAENALSGKKMKIYRDSRSTPISPKDLEVCRGTDTYIMADLCGHPSIYRVMAIKGQSLPYPIFADDIGYSSSRMQELNESWAELSKMAK